MIRLSESNYNVQETFKLYKATGLYKYNKPKNLMVLDSESDLSELAELSGRDVKQLELLTFQPYLHNVLSVKSATLSYHFDHFGTSMYRSQVCPQCLREHGYMRKIWDLTVVTTCHIHNCKLLDQCLACNKILSPYRKRINFCDCGFDLRGLPDLDSLNFEISKLLHGKLYDIKSKSPNESTFFDNHSFFTCVCLILCFAGVISGEFYKEKRLKYSQPLQDSKMPELVQIVYELFQGWPSNFYCLLDAYRIVKKNNKKVFWKFHNLIFNKLNFPHYKNIQEAYKQYFSKYGDTGYCFVETLTYNNKKFLDLLQINEEDFKKILKPFNGISQSVRKRVVYRQNKNNLNPDDKLVTTQVMMDSLGICIEQVNAFRERGIIQAIRGPEIDGFRKWLFSNKALQQLLNTLNKRVIYKIDDNELLIDIKQAKKIVSTWGLTFCDLIEGILNGEIRTYSRKKDSGLKELRFVKDDIMKFLKKDNMNVNEISRELKVCKKYIYSWTQKGYLISSSLSSGAVVIINKTDYLRFKKTYITGSEALKQQTRVKSVESLVRFLRERDIEPVSGPKVDDGHGYLFKRDELLYYWLSQMREK